MYMCLFYSEIPLPFPNSSYLLEPSNPMAIAEMQIFFLFTYFLCFGLDLQRQLEISEDKSQQLENEKQQLVSDQCNSQCDWLRLCLLL